MSYHLCATLTVPSGMESGFCAFQAGLRTTQSKWTDDLKRKEGNLTVKRGGWGGYFNGEISIGVFFLFRVFFFILFSVLLL